MSILSKKEKTEKPKGTYSKITTISKLSSPILKALYYILIVGVLITAIIAFIMIFVGTSPEGIMLPPFMSVHGEEYYSITIGNGIRINADYASVGLGDIKSVIYAELMMLATVFCILAPVSLFLSKLTKNVGKGEEYNLKNPRYVMYIAFSVMIGSTFLRIVRNFYNFLLVKTFVGEPENIKFAFEFNLGGIALGILIIILAYFYGNLCEKNFLEKSTPSASHELEKI